MFGFSAARDRHKAFCTSGWIVHLILLRFFVACIQMGISSFTANLSDYKTVRFVQKGAFVLAQELAYVVCACVVCARVCVCVSLLMAPITSRPMAPISCFEYCSYM